MYLTTVFPPFSEGGGGMELMTALMMGLGSGCSSDWRENPLKLIGVKENNNVQEGTTYIDL